MEPKTPSASFWHNPAERLLQALESPDFYMAIAVAAACFALALLLSAGAKRALQRALQKSQFNQNKQALLCGWLFKASPLFAPLIAILLIGCARPIADEILGRAGVLDAAIRLGVAWLFVTLSLLVVNSKPVAWFIAGMVALHTLLGVSGFLPGITAYLGTLSFELGKYKLSMLGLVQGLFIFVVVFWAAGQLSQLVENYLKRATSLAYNVRELISKFFRLLMFFIAFIVTMDALGVDLTALAVFGGALGVGVGLGLQKITANFVSGVLILLEKSIKIGDLVEVGTFLGWVRQLHMRYTLIETFDGREVLVPNEELLTSRVTNWTYSNEHARIEIMVPVSYEADPRQAQSLMLEAACAHPLTLKTPAPTCSLKQFGDGSLMFALNFWIPDIKEGRGGPQSDVMFGIMERFKAAGIIMPYKQDMVRHEPAQQVPLTTSL